jgi:hypothetical protein
MIGRVGFFAGLAVLLLAWPYIDLEVAVDVVGWHLNAPVADLAALALAPPGALALLRAGVSERARLPLSIALAGYGLMLAAGVASAVTGRDPAAALHEFVRKPLFFGVVYGLGITGGLLAWGPGGRVKQGLTAAVALCATLSLATSVARIVAGDALWFHAVDGLTNNHKTLAVAMAPALPLLWGWTGEPPDRPTRAVVLLGAVALLASWSRTSWISAAAAAMYFLAWRGRPLAAMRGLVPALVTLGLVLATWGPLLTGSITQLDAMRSRHSLDKRAWFLFVESPLVGAGPGASVRIEVPTFPDYRVNGVDAHGVVQKVASEYGLLGLAGYGLAVWALGRALREGHRAGRGAWPAFVALHVNLLLSTETFSQTHWLMFALVLAVGLRDPAPERP